MFFRRNRKQAKETAFEEYQRLVEGGELGSFLDVDTTLLISDRDEIESAIQLGKSNVDRSLLSRLDELFVKKTNDDLKIMKQRIKERADDRDYLMYVIKTVADFGSDEPREKWWFHLLDSER